MKPFVQKLTANGPVITDGAWGTQFQTLGLASGELADPWNLSHPDRVEQVARSYVDAGSQVILTNTFRSNRLTLASHGLAGDIVEINRAGVEVSRRAANGKAYVFASLGPSGKLLMSGEVTEAELASVFEEQARILADAKPDAIVVETMSDVAEAVIAVRAAATTGLPVVVSLVFDTGKNKDRTMMGDTPERAAEQLAAAGADIIGANCGQGIAGYIPVCRRLKAASDRPVWIKANAGLPELEGGRTVYKTTAAEFASQVPALKDAGASFIGGCCGTSPEFIRAIRGVL
ncbi:MAG: homocysteine S-methyltransferase family protein [Bryobacteraceae bacterium]